MNKIKELIRLSRSDVGVEESNALRDVIKSGFLGMGPKVIEFESKIAEFLEVSSSNVCCVSSGTSALHLAIEALGLNYDDEIIVPSMTYIASFQAITASGCRPIACDIKMNGLICEKSVRSLITQKTKAIMPVHYASSCEGIENIYQIAKDFNLRIIEDAAHSFGGSYKSEKIGASGDIVCFSFDGIKNITSGEGGCIISSDETLINKAKDARLLGVVNDTYKRAKRKRSWDFDVVNRGFRYHMSDIMAAIGIEQLKKLSRFKKIRTRLANEYIRLLDNKKNITIVRKDFHGNIPHLFPILVPSALRNRVRKKLLQKGIETGLHYKPNHLLKLYSNNNAELLKVSEEFSKRVITLPMHTHLSINNINMIADELIETTS